MASVGDKVQIKSGGIDVTNGNKAKAGRMYGEGGPLWATVVSIINDWSTGSRWGLPSKVTKVRCAADNGVIVWQVRPEDISSQSISPSQVDQTPAEPVVENTPQPEEQRKYIDTSVRYVEIEDPELPALTSNAPFAPDGYRYNFLKGEDSISYEEDNIDTYNHPVIAISDSAFDGAKVKMNYKRITDNVSSTVWNSEKFKSHLKELGYSSGQIDSMTSNFKKVDRAPKSVEVKSVMRAEYENSWEDGNRRIELLNGNKSAIQNQYNFPFESVPYDKNSLSAAKYDYQIMIGDPRLPTNSPISTLEDRLMTARAALGIPVHGNNDIARSMKMFMYNRFKVPDLNLAHNKTITHIFFTRPDLNIMKTGTNEVTDQINKHSDSSLLWRTHPEIFKLLTDGSRCNDDNNFNMLLSNQISSFNLDDEKILTNKSAKNWHGYEMVYGEHYDGRGAGEFSCTFDETQNYDVISLIKLWVTYIDNVSKGAWSPYYNNNSRDEYCHVNDRALDYAASMYVFKCGPDGEEVLYWSKYYGVIPTTTGSSIFAWDKSNGVGDSPKPTITFAYSFKKDLSPISLLEFNYNANFSETQESVDSWVEKLNGENVGHCARPYVGCPYIEMDFAEPNLGSNDSNRSSKRSSIRLKFRADTNPSRSDEILFKNNTANIINKGVTTNA